MLLTTITLAGLLPLAAGEPIHWHSGTFDAALAAADAKHTHALVYVWAEGSEQCVRMYGETMADEVVARQMDEFVCYSANTAGAAAHRLVERYGVTSIPTVLALLPDGSVDDAVIGFIDAGGLVAELQRIRRGEGTVSALRAAAKEAGDDVAAWYALAVKLADCGDTAGRRAVVERVHTIDPEGEQEVSARLFLEELQAEILAAAQREDGSYDFAAADLQPLLGLLAKTEHAGILFDGWTWVGAVRERAENSPGARAAQRVAWEHVCDDRRMEYGAELTRAFFEQREELDRDERKFVLAVAEELSKGFDSYAREARAEAKDHEGGCASLEGCGEGAGCGGCEGVEGRLVRLELGTLECLARAMYVNGRRSKALRALEKGLALAPEDEGLEQLLELVRDGA